MGVGKLHDLVVHVSLHGVWLVMPRATRRRRRHAGEDACHRPRVLRTDVRDHYSASNQGDVEAFLRLWREVGNDRSRARQQLVFAS